MRFSASSFVPLGPFQSSSGSAAILRTPLGLPVLSLLLSSPGHLCSCFILCVGSPCGSSFSFGALVLGVIMRMPIALLFLCLSLLLLLVADSVVGRLLSYSLIPSLCYCSYCGVSIPSPCVSVSLGSVSLFWSGLCFLLWGLERLFIALRPVSLVSSFLLSFVWHY